MTNFTAKVIAAFLCVVFMVCMFPASAFADSAVPHFDTYTVLGDSNPSGFGLDAYYENAGGMKIKDGDLIAGSYPAIVADAITADKVNVYSHCAWRVNELLRVIDPEFNWDDGFSNIYYTGLHYDGKFGFDTDAFAAKIPDAIREADVITMHFGSNDVFTHAVNRTTDAYPNLLDSLAIEHPDVIDENLLSSLIFDAAEKAGILADVVVSFENFINDNCRIFKDNMARAVAKVHEMNPDAEIYVVGALNSANQTYQTDNGVLLSLPTFTDARFMELNCYLRELCESVDNCTFVDVTNTDMYGISVLDLEETFDDDGIAYTALKVVHPSEKGHVYIANQIINAVKNNATAAPTVTVTKTSILKKNILSWNKLDGAAMYRVYRSTSEDGDYQYIGSTCRTTFYDGLSLYSNYYYKVCAVMDYKNGIVSEMSNAVCAK